MSCGNFSGAIFPPCQETQLWDCHSGYISIGQGARKAYGAWIEIISPSASQGPCEKETVPPRRKETEALRRNRVWVVQPILPHWGAAKANSSGVFTAPHVRFFKNYFLGWRCSLVVENTCPACIMPCILSPPPKKLKLKINFKMTF